MYKIARSFLMLVVLGCFFQAARAQDKRITVEDFTKKRLFSPKSVYGLRWMRDGGRYSTLEENKVVVYDVSTGEQVEVLLDGNSLSEDLNIEDYSFSPDEQKILLMIDKEGIYRYSYTAIYYLYERSSQTLSRLSEGRQAYATFSPQGDKIAYTQENNLYYYDLSTQAVVQITDDGAFNAIINGSADWVYEEELMLTKAFDWSSDGKRLAYYRFDEQAVKEFTMQVWTGTHPYPYPYTFKYPKAGEDNAKVEIYVYSLEDKKKQRIALGSETDIYIPRIRWTRSPTLLSIERLNRLQNQRDILHADLRTGKVKEILSEKSETYVDFNFCDDLYYLKDGKHFIYSSEKRGFKHFYLYKMSGEQVRALTSGNWEAVSMVGIDETSKRPILYYISTERGFMERHLYKVPVKGGNKVLLTNKKGVYRINMSQDFSHYVSYHSSPTKPLTVSLYRTKDNVLVKTLQENAALAERTQAYGFAEKEYFSFPTKNQDLLHGYLLKPKNMDTSKKYPLLVHQYSGPGLQIVYKNWGRSHYAFHQMLVQQGIVVAVVDTRGTGGRGAAFKKITYAQMGKYESEDLMEAAKYLTELPYVDKERLGIWGWSYGGYMSSLALFLPDSPYSLAIAVAPVGNWRFYDTIYTERYLKRPQENASGYDDYSPVTHASTMQGKYLLIHGTGDDNVHFQNAIALQDALIKAGKQFSTFYYPNEAHSLRGCRAHLYQMMADFIMNNL